MDLGKILIIVVSFGGLASEEEQQPQQNKNINDREDWRSFSDIQLLLRFLFFPIKCLIVKGVFIFLLADGLELENKLACG